MVKAQRSRTGYRHPRSCGNAARRAAVTNLQLACCDMGCTGVSFGCSERQFIAAILLQITRTADGFVESDVVRVVEAQRSPTGYRNPGSRGNAANRAAVTNLQRACTHGCATVVGIGT